ncbi:MULTISPECIES: hypothetical protein [Sphingomonadaceae]|uniref:Uncharacterized protein n=1 Tax=Sphingomonas bisphenolicum TaxID=296544 RepID=A0ABM7G3Z6_9SPHN|nr:MULTISPECIES: hypothetical protein [Sphingomonadaceae]KAA9011238.1 hypothetical protein F4U94_21320 [Sphingobium limneticum]BBF70584.1 hypothetical protein SBA_ch1_27840 [Sphingomonas bisphenolicum]
MAEAITYDAGNDDDAGAFAEGAITLWGNLLALMGTHLLETGMARQEVLDMLTILHETNEETIRSPRARAVAARHLMSVYEALGKA